MTKIEGIISDQISDIESREYIVLHTYNKMKIKYSHYNEFVPNTYNDPQLYIKVLPSFNEVYETFMLHNESFLFHKKTQDICLSLFYNPYFNEIYEMIKKDYKHIPKSKLNILTKHLLSCLADPIQYKIIVEQNMYEKSPTRAYYIDKDIFKKSNELLKLFNN